MIFELKNVNVQSIISNNKKEIILYADFNVLNYLYKNKIQIPREVTLYPDSTAVYFILKLFYNNQYSKLVSTDLQIKLLEESNKKNKKVFFFGDSNRILQELENKLKNNFPEILIAGKYNGYKYNSKEVIKTINISNADILFVGLGLWRQEKWIIENHKNINTKLIIAVGGWFQYLAENKKRAPKVLRKFHLEWFIKLIKEFKIVWKRYFIGIPLFIYRVATKKIQLVIVE